MVSKIKHTHIWFGAGIILTLVFAVGFYFSTTQTNALSTNSTSVELGLTDMPMNNSERGYAMPASGHSPPSPTVNLNAKVKPLTLTSDSYSDLVLITPEDELTLTWSGAEADSCSTNFSSSSSSSGSSDVTPNLNPGESFTYQVTCTGHGGSGSDSIVVRVPNLLVNTFMAEPNIVRSGETVDLIVILELSESLSETPSSDYTPYSYQCEVRGATPDGTPYIFDAANAGDQLTIVTRKLTSKYLNSLSCDAYVYEETEVEVTPYVQ